MRTFACVLFVVCLGIPEIAMAMSGGGGGAASGGGAAGGGAGSGIGSAGIGWRARETLSLHHSHHHHAQRLDKNHQDRTAALKRKAVGHRAANQRAKADHHVLVQRSAPKR